MQIYAQSTTLWSELCKQSGSKGWEQEKENNDNINCPGVTAIQKENKEKRRHDDSWGWSYGEVECLLSVWSDKSVQAKLDKICATTLQNPVMMYVNTRCICMWQRLIQLQSIFKKRTIIPGVQAPKTTDRRTKSTMISLWFSGFDYLV